MPLEYRIDEVLGLLLLTASGDVTFDDIDAYNHLQYGLARMYGQFLAPSGQEVRPFREVDDAREWLGLAREGEGT